MEMKTYISSVVQYIKMEYGTEEYHSELTEDEEYAIKNIIETNFQANTSSSNTASDIINYIRVNRDWMKRNIK